MEGAYKKDSCGESMTTYDRTLEDYSYDQLAQRLAYFSEESSDAFHKGLNEISSQYLLAAERMLNEMKLTVLTSSI